MNFFDLRAPWERQSPDSNHSATNAESMRPDLCVLGGDMITNEH